MCLRDEDERKYVLHLLLQYITVYSWDVIPCPDFISSPPEIVLFLSIRQKETQFLYDRGLPQIWLMVLVKPVFVFEFP